MNNVVRLIACLFFIVTLFILPSTALAQDKEKIYYFYGTGCPHCAEVSKYFEKEDIFNRYPIDKREIYFDHSNALLYSIMLDRLQIPTEERGVPIVIIGDIILTGDRSIIDNFITEADTYLIGKQQPASVSDQPNIQNTNSKDTVPQTKTNLTLPAIIAGSLVDAINPCEFAVLIILMTTILAGGKARTALRAGLAFSLSIFLSYFLMGLGLYKALTWGGLAGWFFKLIGWLAVILGLANLKDYFWYGKGFLMEVPLSWRPRLKALIHSVTSPAGAFVIGFAVSLFLLPCTSGPYIVILGMLAKKTFNTQAVLYLLLYNLIFVSPMVIISFAVYKGFDPKKAEEIRQKRLRVLHLIAGIVMLLMGIVILSGWI